MRNDDRRAALLDGAVEVLASEGARGLTFRAVDEAADVPPGTASNYFANRDQLLDGTARHVFVRLQPDAATLARGLAAPRDRDCVRGLLNELVERLTTRRSVYLALLELRLEATRRPALRELLTEVVRADVEANVAYHLGSGLPGDADAVLLLYVGLTGLLVERLTLPDVLGEDVADRLVAQLVARVLPPAPG